MNRRSLLKNTLIAGVTLPILDSKSLWASNESVYEKLVILHTNDTHSRIDPFESGEFKGQGGVSARKTLIDKVRSEEKNVLLLDAGDMFQGTPYFNLFGGELEIKAMSYLGYDASIIGNHDFDNGADNLANQFIQANFPFIISNYGLENSPLHQKMLPYKTFQKGKIKVGILGIGIELAGLVAKKNYGEIIYQDPVEMAQKTANILKFDEKCDIIICLSHLGYSYKEKDKISDLNLAEKVDNIDIILGGHTHTFLSCPKIIQKNEKKFVIVNQVGWGGITLGKLDIYFNKEKNKIEKNTSDMLKCQI